MLLDAWKGLMKLGTTNQGQSAQHSTWYNSSNGPPLTTEQLMEISLMALLNFEYT